MVAGARVPDTAIIGAGPAGLAAARWLIAHGFEPVLLEAAGGLGGQWRTDGPLSGIWPDMRANTSRWVTRFSDLDYPAGTPMFPHNSEVLAHLEAYAGRFGLDGRLRASCRVERLAPGEAGGWTLQWREADGTSRTASFARVVVASGRYNAPAWPDIEGLQGFTGDGGVVHTFRYKDPDLYRGRRVLVAGGAISALEAASDLAMIGAAGVTVACRRQRYVMPKVSAGVPADSRFSRYGALAAETLPVEVRAMRLQDWLLRIAGDPARYGAAAPDPDVLQAGVSLCQHFLPLVAEGRIATRPWIAAVNGQDVTFADGRTEAFDAILLGTGFHLRLPFLDAATSRTLGLDDEHIDLADFTFHPDLPGLAFVGLIPQTGPYFPVLELQARWLAYAWNGVRPAPDRAALEAGVEAYRATRGDRRPLAMHAVAMRFSRLAGVEPDVSKWPDIARALLFGPLTSASFRLSGPDAMDEAPGQIVLEAAAHGSASTAQFTSEEQALVRELAGISDDPNVTAWGRLVGG